jgi:hypothetical protein
MLGEGTLTIKEFAMREPLPLATIQDAVLEFLQGRQDAVVYGAHAVNAYAEEPRMTQEVDILSNRAPELAEELREALLRFPELKRDLGPVTERLTSQGADAAVLATWKKLVEQELLHEDEEAGF